RYLQDAFRANGVSTGLIASNGVSTEPSPSKAEAAAVLPVRFRTLTGSLPDIRGARTWACTPPGSGPAPCVDLGLRPVWTLGLRILCTWVPAFSVREWSVALQLYRSMHNPSPSTARMLKNHLHLALRTLKRHRGYAALNVLSLGIGL